MDKKNVLLVCLLITAMDVAAGILGIEAQTAQNKVKHLRLSTFVCRNRSPEAFRLGLAAAMLLALAHVVGNLLGGCVCMLSREEFKKSSAIKQLAAISLIFSWIILAVGFSLLILGTFNNSKSSAILGTFNNSNSSAPCSSSHYPITCNSSAPYSSSRYPIPCNPKSSTPCSSSPYPIPCNPKSSAPCSSSPYLIPCNPKSSAPCSSSPYPIPCNSSAPYSSCYYPIPRNSSAPYSPSPYSTPRNSSASAPCSSSHYPISCIGGILCFIHGLFIVAYYISATASAVPRPQSHNDEAQAAWWLKF